MTAIWVLLGLAVLFGGVILTIVVYAVRHDDSGERSPAGTEAGRFSGEPGTPREGEPGVPRKGEPGDPREPEAAGLRAGRGPEVWR